MESSSTAENHCREQLLGKATVIIPAHNRPERLRRLLTYYKGSGIHVIVPDSSTEPFTTLDQFPDVAYRHAPRTHMLVKVHDILGLITTPYVLYCADDDFATKDGIAAMVEYLESHPQCSSAQGHYITFMPKATKHGTKVSYKPRYLRHFTKTIEAATPGDRLAQETGMYCPLLYSVVRTEAFVSLYNNCFDEAGQLRFKNLFLAEEYFGHCILMHGGCATLPVFYSAREFIPNSATTFVVTLAEVKSSPKYIKEYEGYLKSLAITYRQYDRSATEDEAMSLARHISMAPQDVASVNWKRWLLIYTSRKRGLHWITDLMNWRYNQKGMRIVDDMPSYPCSHATPARNEIEALIKSSNWQNE